MAGRWTAEDIPDQNARLAVVTGANGGLGLSVARELARGCAGGDGVPQPREASQAGTTLKSMVAHPGYAATNLQFAGPPAYEQAVMKVGVRYGFPAAAAAA